jgi:class 3 adenylate cyclase
MRKKASTLKKFDLQIGIHTGKILGGLIGQNYIRYDIFGEDVFTTFKIMADGPSGFIRMSEKTHNLIQLNQFIVDTLEF